VSWRDRLSASILGHAFQFDGQGFSGIARTLADAGQLENVLINLAVNARDAMPGGGDVVIKTFNERVNAATHESESQISPGNYVVLSVSDTGVGMPPEVKERAFEPFFTTKSVGKGSGLGLSTVYGFAKQSGGLAAIQSQPARGTTVRVYLPQVESTIVDLPIPSAGETPGRGEIVLVVEDDPSVRGVVATMVEKLGYQVLEAGEAVDLVLTDVVMPGAIDGWKLAETVWARWPRTRVLLMTGYSEGIFAQHAALKKRAQVIVKPYRRSEMSRRIREVLDGIAA